MCIENDLQYYLLNYKVGIYLFKRYKNNDFGQDICPFYSLGTVLTLSKIIEIHF